MNIKDGIVHPLAVLSNSSKPINTVEQRQYLYDQERQLEKSVRYQEGISNSINKLINSRENQIKSILEYQSNQQNIQVQAIEDIGWGIDGLGDKIDYGMEVLSNGLQQLNETQLLGFQEELKALGILDYNVKTGFNNLLNSIESQTIIFQNVSSQIGEIIETLHNPRKIEGLEYKKDAINNLQNKWFDEALEYFKLAAEKLTTDQEVYFLIGLIEFEENKNYEEAIINFEKAIKYADGYDDVSILMQSKDKLASIYFILAGQNGLKNSSIIQKAYKHQLETVNTEYYNTFYIFDLLKYSAVIGEYNTFEENLYKLLKLNPSIILNISINPIFTKNPKILEIIDYIIEKIKIEKEKENKVLIEKKEYEKNLENKINKIEVLQNDINIMETLQFGINIKAEEVTNIYNNGISICKDDNDEYGNERYYLINENGEVIYKNIKEPKHIPNIGVLGTTGTIGSKSLVLINNKGKIIEEIYPYYGNTGWCTFNNGTLILPKGTTPFSKSITLNDGTVLSHKSIGNNFSYSCFNYDKGYALTLSENSLYKLYKNGYIEKIKNINNYYDELKTLKDFNYNCNFGEKNNIDNFIKNKVIKIIYENRVSFNFVKNNGDLLIKDNSFKINKYVELENYINNYLIGKFDNKGKGQIKILNKTYSITRKKNIYGFYSYNFSINSSKLKRKLPLIQKQTKNISWIGILPDEIINNPQNINDSILKHEEDYYMQFLKELDLLEAITLIKDSLTILNTNESQKMASVIYMIERYGSLYTKGLENDGKFIWYRALGGEIGDHLFNNTKKELKEKFSEDTLIHKLLIEQCKGTHNSGIKRRNRIHKDFKFFINIGGF